MSNQEKHNNQHSIQLEEGEGGGEEEEGACRPWYMIPRAALRRASSCDVGGKSPVAAAAVDGGVVDVPPPPSSQVVDDRSSSTTSSTATLSNDNVRQWLDRSPTHSNTSTQSGSSGSLLLTAANLAALRLESGATGGGGGAGCGGRGVKDPDAASLASSTHFTVVNYGRGKPTKRSICAKHTVSALVISTCSLFLLGLTAAIYYIDMRTKSIKYS